MTATLTGKVDTRLAWERPSIRLSNSLVAFYACLAVLIGFLAVSENCQHWFVVPVFLCGLLIGVDAVAWCRGQVDVLDPKAIMGLFGVHFFFLAPLLHVYLDSWMWEVDQPPDWRPWLGWMAILNVFGLIVYRFVVARLESRSERVMPRGRIWIPEPKRIKTLLVWAIGIGTVLQLSIYAAFGGISGYMAAYKDHQANFLGVTWVMMLAGRVPLLAFMGATLYLRAKKRHCSWFALGGMLAAFIVAQLLFGGLRGERSDIIYALFWAVGIVHYWVRPLPKKLILGGAGFVLLFLYVYAFYKFGGTEGMRDLAGGGQSREAVQEHSHFSIQDVALGDLGRSDVQAYELYRISRPESDYSYALGRTYLGDLGMLLPGPVWRNRPPSKVKEVWDVLFGARTYEREFGTTAFSDREITTRLFGLTGEMMLNFGPLPVPLAFAILGLVVGWTRRRIAEWRTGDARLFLAPFLTTVCLLVLTADLDNVLYYCQMSGSVPAAILFLGSTRVKRGKANDGPENSSERTQPGSSL